MAEQTTKPVFDIRKVYIKDFSLESPNTPNIFLDEQSQPDVSVEASINPVKLEQENYYEVILSLTVTAKMGDSVAFLVEVQQAGIFQIAGIPEKDMPMALEIACPNVLLPFAREAISDLVGKGGFPQLLLAPMNFELLFQQKRQKLAEAEKEKAESTIN